MTASTINSLRILTISDIQGNIDALQELYSHEINHGRSVDLIIHTGNFGFWDRSTIEDYRELNYLKQIVSFLEVLEPELVEELNNLSLIVTGNSDNTIGDTHEDISKFKSTLLQSKNSVSQFSEYLAGSKQLPCPVYTIFGPLDDPRIVDKLQTRQYLIPNLFLIDHKHSYEIETPLHNLPNLKIYGIGGTVKVHSLFDRGNLDYDGLCGKVGELWISLLQIAEFYLQFSDNFTTSTNSFTGDNTVNIFVAHAPVIKTPLLEHLAIITHADFTISQGLHFRYPVMGNGMSFVDSMGGSAGYIENYRGKFTRLRKILGELWLVIKDDLIDMLLSEPSSLALKNSIELGLSLFDKIPVIVNDPNDKIVSLTLLPEENIDSVTDETNKKVVKRLNDYYFQAYYNLWHFNLCDYRASPQDMDNDYNIMIFKFDQFGNFTLDYCNSQGFNFAFKAKQQEEQTIEDTASGKDTTNNEPENIEHEVGAVEESAKSRHGTHNRQFRGSYRNGLRGGRGDSWSSRGGGGGGNRGGPYRGRGSSGGGGGGGYRGTRGRGRPK